LNRAAQPAFGIVSIRLGDQRLGHEPIQLRLVPPLVGSLDWLASGAPGGAQDRNAGKEVDQRALIVVRIAHLLRL